MDKFKYLSSNFLATFPNNPPAWNTNTFGGFVYKRTYSRWLPEQKRRETWKETVARVVEYSMSLYQGPSPEEYLQQEAELLFKLIFDLKVFPAGRTLWVGGTEAVKKYPLANFNCSFRVMNDFEAFTDIFYLLMLGVGTGFRVMHSDVSQLPAINPDVALAHKPYHGKAKHERIEHTMTFQEDDSFYIVVGDSKEGWVEALRQYLRALATNGIESIVINYDSVRPSGEVLKTFGGRASGHTALRDMFKKIHKVIRSGGEYLMPVQVMDMCNIIAQAVVVGGVRRSSQIALFDPTDDQVMNAKVDLYTDVSKAGKDYRSQSNNSLYLTEKPSRDYLADVFKRILSSYEPGFINATAARKRRPWYEGTNPCSEILLDNKGVCNLTEVNIRAFVTPEGKLEIDDLEKAVMYAARVGLRQTNVTLELPEWDAVQKRDRLIGVSITGMMDAFDLMHEKTGATWDEYLKVLNHLNKVANMAALQYAHEMRIPAPLLSCAIKPSGTISQLPTVSSGAHRSFARYFIRRVRISKTDPLAEVMYNLGYPVYPDGIFADVFDKASLLEKQQMMNKTSTWVIEFPVKTSALVRAADEPAVDQFRRYLDLQQYYTDHNTSITIYFSEEEIPALIDMLLEEWDNYIGVAFAVKDSGVYPLMPYEEINEEEFLRRWSDLAGISTDTINAALEELELRDMASELEDADCATGACPVR